MWVTGVQTCALPICDRIKRLLSLNISNMDKLHDQCSLSNSWFQNKSWSRRAECLGNYYCLAHSIIAKHGSACSKQNKITGKNRRNASGELQQQGLLQLPPWPCEQQLLSDVAPPCRSCSCAGTAVEETIKAEYTILLIMFLKITQQNEMEVQNNMSSDWRLIFTFIFI